MKNLLEKCKKINPRLGNNQKNILFLLSLGQKVVFKDHCTAQSRYNSYVSSWKSMISTIQEAGYEVYITPGKLGGTWSESIQII